MKQLALSTALLAALSLVLTGCPKAETAAPSDAPPPASNPDAHPVNPPTDASASPAPTDAPATVDAAAVTAALKAADASLESVTVTVEEKAIKLTGTVANNDLKKKAGEAVTALAGDKKVINQLLVK